MDNIYLENLEEWVCVEDKIVTFKSLAYELDVPANTAKKMLYEFAKVKGKSVVCIYFLSGLSKGPDGIHTISLVTEESVEAEKNKLSKVTSIHVYSVQQRIPKDTSSLYSVSATQRRKLMKEFDTEKAENLLNARWSAIILPKARNRDTTIAKELLYSPEKENRSFHANRTKLRVKGSEGRVTTARVSSKKERTNKMEDFFVKGASSQTSISSKIHSKHKPVNTVDFFFSRAPKTQGAKPIGKAEFKKKVKEEIKQEIKGERGETSGEEQEREEKQDKKSEEKEKENKKESKDNKKLSEEKGITETERKERDKVENNSGENDRMDVEKSPKKEKKKVCEKQNKDDGKETKRSRKIVEERSSSLDDFDLSHHHSPLSRKRKRLSKNKIKTEKQSDDKNEEDELDSLTADIPDNHPDHSQQPSVKQPKRKRRRKTKGVTTFREDSDEDSEEEKKGKTKAKVEKPKPKKGKARVLSTTRKRKTKRKLVSQTYKNEKGYTVTEDAWVDVLDEEEEEPTTFESKPKTTSVSSFDNKPRTQANITSFFTKKK